jgi:hypothetical protein
MCPATMREMGRFFTITKTSDSEGVATLTMGFLEPADNAQIVPDAIAVRASLKLPGGRGIRFNGAASLPVAMVQ